MKHKKSLASRKTRDSESTPQLGINKQQIAQAMGVTERTIDRLREARKIPFWKIGGIVRFDLDQVKTHIREHYTEMAA